MEDEHPSVTDSVFSLSLFPQLLSQRKQIFFCATSTNSGTKRYKCICSHAELYFSREHWYTSHHDYKLLFAHSAKQHLRQCQIIILVLCLRYSQSSEWRHWLLRTNKKLLKLLRWWAKWRLWSNVNNSNDWFITDNVNSPLSSSPEAVSFITMFTPSAIVVGVTVMYYETSRAVLFLHDIMQHNLSSCPYSVISPLIYHLLDLMN